jgi:hypothetical protein
MDQLNTLCGSSNVAIKIGGSRVIVGNWFFPLLELRCERALRRKRATGDAILPRRRASQKFFF